MDLQLPIAEVHLDHNDNLKWRRNIVQESSHQLMISERNIKGQLIHEINPNEYKRCIVE